jgi:hypothetical protein
MKEQRLLVAYEELAKLHIERLDEGGNAEEIGSNFGDLRHDGSCQKERRKSYAGGS